MINISYKLKGEVVDLRSDLLRPFKETDADIYIDKQKDWLSFSVEFNQSISSFKSQIFDIKRTKKNTKLKTNTTALSITDIIINSIPYYYKLILKTENSFNLDSLKAILNLKELEYRDGKYYTNTPTYYYSDDCIAYTEKIIPKDFEIAYKSKYIEITTLPDVHFKLDEFVISPQIINPYMVYIPSFYLETSSSKLYRSIDSNINYFTSNANTSIGNYLRYKLSESTETASKDFNVFLGTANSEVLKFRVSSNCLPLKSNTEYFKILPNGSIIKGSQKDYFFKVSKKIDHSKIVITPNNYKIEHSEKRKSNLLGTIVNSFEEDNKEFNDFGIIYKDINRTVPRNFYISYGDTYIMSSKGDSVFKGTFKEKSLKEDGFKMKAINPLFKNDTSSYIHLDGKNYEVLDDN